MWTFSDLIKISIARLLMVTPSTPVIPVYIPRLKTKKASLLVALYVFHVSFVSKRAVGNFSRLVI